MYVSRCSKERSDLDGGVKIEDRRRIATSMSRRGLACGSRFSAVDVSNDDDIDVHLLLTTCCQWWLMMEVEVDSPHDCGIEGLTVCVWFGFLSKEIESSEKEN